MTIAAKALSLHKSAKKEVQDVKHKSSLGQFFTVNSEVQSDMVSLLTHPARNQLDANWKVLEPSCGAGHLLSAAVNSNTVGNLQAEGWELDSSVTPVDSDLNIRFGDFFALSRGQEKSFHSIIGNPPYVAWKSASAETKKLAEQFKKPYSDKVNLYHLFIDRCIDLLAPGGELVFIVPKEWLYTTSATVLRNKIQREGFITHLIDGGEEKVFPDADVPAIVVFRFQKFSKDESAANNALALTIAAGSTGAFNSNHSRSVLCRSGLTSKTKTDWESKTLFVTNSGHWLFVSENVATEISTWTGKVLGDYLSVKVGMVSGADGIFNVSSHSSLSEFLSEGSAVPFATTKGIEHYLETNSYFSEKDIPAKTLRYLKEHKEFLLSRRIARFDESNWWKWGAVRNKETMLSQPQRVYAFAKTRRVNPFFMGDSNDAFGNEVSLFGGGLLALFLKSNQAAKMRPKNTSSNSGRDINDLFSQLNKQAHNEQPNAAKPVSPESDRNSDETGHLDETKHTECDWTKNACDYLNSPIAREIFEAMGMTTSNKLSLQPSTLESMPIPPYLVDLLKIS